LFGPKPRIAQVWHSILGVLLITRAFTSGLISLAVFLPLYWAGKGVGTSFYSCIPFLCAAAGGFAMNDYHDLPKDRINKPYRALPSGKISGRAAYLLAVALMVLACLASLLFFRTKLELLLYLGSILGVGFYNVVLKHLSLSKTVLTAAISVLPLFYVTSTLAYPSVYLLIPIGGLFFLIGRELLMDIRDINGDKRARMKTLPMIVGSRATAASAFLLFALCGVLLAVFTLNVWSVRNAILAGAILSTSFVLPYPWSYKNGKYRRPVIISLYAPILCGILLLIR
jgi:4-hydroxybenzoate polyprenyltransferase